MFDWLKNLFSGGSNKSSGASSRPTNNASNNRNFTGGAPTRQGTGFDRPLPQDDSVMLARQREEEERKKREAAEKKKKAEEASRKLEQMARLKQQESFNEILKKPAPQPVDAVFNPAQKLAKAPVVDQTVKQPAQPKPKPKFNFKKGIDSLVKAPKEFAQGVAYMLDPTEAFQDLSKGIAETASYDTKAAKEAREAKARLQQQTIDLSRRAGQKMKDPNTSPAEKARWNKTVTTEARRGTQQFRDADDITADTIESTDPVKGAINVVGVAGALADAKGVATAGGDIMKSFKANKLRKADDGAKVNPVVQSTVAPENKIEVAPGVKTNITSSPTKYSDKPPLRTNTDLDAPAFLRKQEADAQAQESKLARDAELQAIPKANPVEPTPLELDIDQRLALKDPATETTKQFPWVANAALENGTRDTVNVVSQALAKANDPKALRRVVENFAHPDTTKAEIDEYARQISEITDPTQVQDILARSTQAPASNARIISDDLDVPTFQRMKVTDSLPEAPAYAVNDLDIPAYLRKQSPGAPVNIPNPAGERALAKATDIPAQPALNDVPIAQFRDSVEADVPLQKAPPVQAPVANTTGADMNGNVAPQTDVEMARQLQEQGVVPERGNSVVATQEDEMAREARQIAGETNAPEVRAQVTSRINDDELRADLETNAPMKETVNLADAEMSAKNYLNSLSDERLVDQFALGVVVDNPESFFRAINGIRRLERVASPEANVAIRNALDAMTDYAAESGRGLRTVQVLFDDMPTVMKVDYLVNKLGKAGAELDDVTRSRLLGMIEGADDATAKLRNLEDEAKQMLEDGTITNQNISPEVLDRVRALRDEIDNAKRQKELRSGEAYRFYQEQLNKSPEGGMPLGKRAGDVGRTLMLSAPSGRFFDVISTAATAADDIATQSVSSLIGKGVNLIKGSGSVEDTMVSPTRLLKGAREGATRIKESFQGKDHVEDFLGEAKRATRGDINSGGGIVRQTVRSAVEAPTNLTRGLREDELYRQGMQEASQLGLQGEARSAYADVRSMVPTQQQLSKAVDTQMRSNMLHENGVSRFLNGFARSLDDNKLLGGWLAPVIRNQIAPFTSWIGGSLNRAFTDKNMVWNVGHAIVEAKRGNTQGVIDDISKLAVNAGTAYAGGALLTQAGLITNEDANGDSYAGLYIHIGDRYIPVAILGTASVPIVLGNAYQQATEAAAEGGNGSETFVNALATNMLKNAGVASVFGGENNFQSTIKKVIDGEPIEAMAEFTGDFVRQYIPAVTADINAFLDQTKMNPTGEAAETKVTEENPDTGRQVTDVFSTEINKTLNRIPVLSQDLPRKAGVLAKDAFDRILKSNRDGEVAKANRIKEDSLADAKQALDNEGIPTTSEKIKELAEEGEYESAIKGAQYRLRELEAKEDSSETSKKNARDDIEKYKLQQDGVPVTDEGVKARLESGEYDLAIRGMEYKLSNIENDKEKPESTKQELRQKIGRTNVYKEGAYAPDVVKAYESTEAKEGGIGVTRWRELMESGDPAAVEYATKLAELDAKMVEGKFASTAKYYWKGGKGGSGKGGGGGRGGSGSGMQSYSVATTNNDISFSPNKLVKREINMNTPQSAIPVLKKVQNYDTSKLKKIKVTRGRVL